MFAKKSQSPSSNLNDQVHKLRFIWVVFGLSLPLSSFAQPLSEFQANFKVQALSMNLGISKHSLKCNGTDCTLTASSKPEGLAKLFLNERSQETIHIQQTDNQFNWLSYTKKYGEDLSNKETLKIETLFINPENPTQIVNPNRQKSWPTQPEVYDSISITYAVQFNVLNDKPLNQLFLQENKRQESLVLINAFQPDPLTLNNGKTFANSQRFDFETQKAKVKIWLLPTYDYFPGRVDVYNIKKDKTLTLVLQEPPKIQ